MFTVNASDGSLLGEGKLHGDPSQAAFYDPPANVPNEGGLNQPKLSFVLNKKTLYLYNMKEPETPTELAFQERYGSIVAYEW